MVGRTSSGSTVAAGRLAASAMAHGPAAAWSPSPRTARAHVDAGPARRSSRRVSRSSRVRDPVDLDVHPRLDPLTLPGVLRVDVQHVTGGLVHDDLRVEELVHAQTVPADLAQHRVDEEGHVVGHDLHHRLPARPAPVVAGRVEDADGGAGPSPRASDSSAIEPAIASRCSRWRPARSVAARWWKNRSVSVSVDVIVRVHSSWSRAVGAPRRAPGATLLGRGCVARLGTTPVSRAPAPLGWTA